MKNDTAVSLLAALLVLALVCVPVMAANVTYPQEYYTLGDKLNGVSGIDLLKLAYGGMYQSIAVPTAMSAMELRRQTILMEKQNELLAEQNELMGRLVNATEIKFECKAIGYVQQASYWSIDEPEVNASDYYYKINPADVVPCANLSYFERANYGCPS
jgi:hypothetical protein